MDDHNFLWKFSLSFVLDSDSRIEVDLLIRGWSFTEYFLNSILSASQIPELFTDTQMNRMATTVVFLSHHYNDGKLVFDHIVTGNEK